jgi:translation elongation factor EF-Tu-like GTPase
LDDSSKSIAEMDLEVEEILAKTKEMEAVLEPIIKQSQTQDVNDVNLEQVSLMQELVELVRAHCAPSQSTPRPA